MRILRLIAAMCALLAPSIAFAQQAPLAGFDAYVGKALSDWKVPGLAIVVVKGDSVLFMKGYGVRELGKSDPVTVHTRFGNMSTTKAFTAMLIAMLADSGRVSFDDPVSKFEPGLQLADPYVTRELTVRDILTHRIGFGDPYYLWDDTTDTFAEMTRRLRMVPVATSFRSHFSYNNVAYAIAGDVAARAAGDGATWQSLMHRMIYQRLGMTESYPDAAEMIAAGVKDVTSPHGLVRDTARLLPVAATVVDPVAPAGAAFSTVTDMAKWLRFLLDSGRVNGRRLVSAPSFAELFRAQSIVGDDEFYPTRRLTHPHFQAYGMGWFLEDYRGEYVAFHTGSIEGRSAIVGLLPDRRVGVAIFTNLDHSELRHALMYTVFDRYIGPASRAHDWSAEMRAMYKAFADTANAQQAREEAKRVAGTHPSLPLERYAGTYGDSLFGSAVVRHANGTLSVQQGSFSGVMEHWQYDVFRITWPDPFQDPTYVAFSLDPDGTVGELRVVGGPQHYRRVR